MAHIEVGVGEVVGGGEGEGGGAPHGGDGQKFCQEGLAEVLINLGDDWEQEFCSRGSFRSLGSLVCTNCNLSWFSLCFMSHQIC